MYFGYLPKLSNSLVIPHPTYICTLVLTLIVVVGYCYIFVYKLALYGCDRAVEAHDPLHIILDSILRLTIALYSLISFIYIIQRANVGSINTKIDLLIRNFINCVFGIIWMRFILLKGYFTIEQFCRDQLEMMSIVKAFCPPYIKKGFNCTTLSLRKEQQVWYRVHYGLLKSVIVTAASEFIPVLLVTHWLACGRAELAVRKMTVKMNTLQAIKKFSLKKFSTVTDANTSKTSNEFLFLKNPLIRCVFRLLAFCLSITGIFLCMLSFYNFVNDLDESPQVFTQDAIEVFISTLKLCFFVMLFIWSRRIPIKLLDLHRKAESKGDKVLIFGSVLFLTAECICEIMELLFFSFHNKRASNFLEAFCLMKLIAIKDNFLKELSPILPFIAICFTILNFNDFVMTYFYIETEKHHLKKRGWATY
ncbi:hypothetical protein Mgra_00004771 [Meloidogyne graminicola]|uniref:Uncharacterized protein n=1 Tax=Meloidogyne graminicola TaxID=189291 RepID=A0A8S9ZRU3_9BILA|nr:hypothetical protein Mgra_00004771 [Meloidogyne graminicola]